MVICCACLGPRHISLFFFVLLMSHIWQRSSSKTFNVFSYYVVLGRASNPCLAVALHVMPRTRESSNNFSDIKLKGIVKLKKPSDPSTKLKGIMLLFCAHHSTILEKKIMIMWRGEGGILYSILAPAFITCTFPR